MQLTKKATLLATVVFMLLSVQAALAQYTTVTATVKDASGNIYANCNVNTFYVNQSSASVLPNLSGSPFQTEVPGVQCNSAGQFTMRLADNNSIAPTPSQWKFSICSQDFKACFTYQTTITGASQDISAGIAAAAASLTPVFVASGSLAGITDPWIDIRAFGAKCDGVTDDTAAIVATVTTANAVARNVFIPGTGTSDCLYQPTTTLVVGTDTNSVVFVGTSGSSIRVKTTSNIDVFSFKNYSGFIGKSGAHWNRPRVTLDATSTIRSLVRNFHQDGTQEGVQFIGWQFRADSGATVTGPAAIDIQYSFWPTVVRDVAVDSFNSVGLHINHGGNVVIEDSLLQGCGATYRSTCTNSTPVVIENSGEVTLVGQNLFQGSSGTNPVLKLDTDAELHGDLLYFEQTVVATWSGVTTFPLNTIVTYNGTLYQSLVGSNLNHQPDISPAQWQAGAVPGPSILLNNSHGIKLGWVSCWGGTSGDCVKITGLSSYSIEISGSNLGGAGQNFIDNTVSGELITGSGGQGDNYKMPYRFLVDQQGQGIFYSMAGQTITSLTNSTQHAALVVASNPAVAGNYACLDFIAGTAGLGSPFIWSSYNPNGRLCLEPTASGSVLHWVLNNGSLFEAMNLDFNGNLWAKNNITAAGGSFLGGLLDASGLAQGDVQLKGSATNYARKFHFLSGPTPQWCINRNPATGAIDDPTDDALCLQDNGTSYVFEGYRNTDGAFLNTPLTIDIANNRVTANGVSLIDRQGVTSAIVGAGSYIDLYSTTLDAGRIGLGKCVRVTAGWQHTSGTASVSFRFELNGSITYGPVGSTSTLADIGDFEICNLPGVQNSQFNRGTTVLANIPSNAMNTTNENFALSTTLKLQFLVANTDQVTGKFWMVEIVQ